VKLSIPVYIETFTRKDGQRAHRVRPLFRPRPERQHVSLERALNLLALDLRVLLHQLGKELRHEQLAEWSFAPSCTHHALKLRLPLEQGNVVARFLFVVFPALERRIAFTPSLPELWFDVERGESLEERATDVLTRYFRRGERGEEVHSNPNLVSLQGKAWLTVLDLEDVHPAQRIRPKEEDQRAVLAGARVQEGEWELQRVGRCLDRLYPDELERAFEREAEVAELGRLLTADDRRPVLLLGSRLVGKTTLLHEHVYRTVEQRQGRHQLRNNVWLLAPQRLISGMSYVGQWEERLLAILKAADRHNHVLYFDDLLGLYQAGITRDSRLSVAHVLRPYVERRAFRMLAEITPEAFRVLRELDRGLAELFHVLPVAEPVPERSLRILVQLQRQLEGRHRCRLSLEVLPAVLDLVGRHERNAAMPGKAAAFLTRLAVKGRNGGVGRQDVLEEMHAQSGLALTFVDTRARLERADVLAELRRRVIGQDAALQAAADVVGIARARLNDPDRPLASFLFLGPTGVGKTQCAKALAPYLFGDADKLLRFDMNEFVSPDAAAQLVGTFSQPEGLLTSAIRRQPFAVLLLDEIEKAHPDVFDLLLQVLGEGRLTDALGRTADFTRAIIILTSNLGVRESQGGLSLQRSAGEDETAFVQAAERFFRPELFNRLDRIVPFGRLSRADIRQIARLLIQDVFQREGLLRRKCLLLIEDDALEKVVDLGYHPLLGARALKRAIEKQLTQPVAAQLAAGLPQALTVISLYAGADGLGAHVEELSEAARVPTPSSLETVTPQSLVSQVRALLARVGRQVAGLRPQGALGAGELRPEHYRFFAVQEQAERVRQRCDELVEELEAAREQERLRSTLSPVKVGRSRRSFKSIINTHRMPPWGGFLREMAAADSAQAYLQSLAAAPTPTPNSSEAAEHFGELRRQAALLELIATAAEGDEQAILWVRPLQETGQPWAEKLAVLYRLALGEEMELDARCDSRETAVLLQGPHAGALARLEEGTHLVYPRHAALLPLQVLVLTPTADGSNASAVAAAREHRREWQQRLASGTAALADDPFALRPVVRVCEEEGVTVDLRTGLLVNGRLQAEMLRQFLLAALPVPAELRTAE
jgi:ATP-dependent Clp protease ATP-binding subunit ClpA